MQGVATLEVILKAVEGRINPQKLKQLRRLFASAMGTPDLTQPVDDPMILRRQLVEQMRRESVSAGTVQALVQFYMGIIRRAALAGLIPAPPEGPWTRIWQSVLDLADETSRADDRRNNLFEQFILFVDFFNPEFVVFENVVGLQHHKDGQTLTSIRAAFEGMGYATDAAILNAVHYGVPQKRERLILLARKGAVKPDFPPPTHSFNGRSMAGQLAISS